MRVGCADCKSGKWISKILQDRWNPKRVSIQKFAFQDGRRLQHHVDDILVPEWSWSQHEGLQNEHLQYLLPHGVMIPARCKAFGFTWSQFSPLRSQQFGILDGGTVDDFCMVETDHGFGGFTQIDSHTGLIFPDSFFYCT